MAAQLDSAVQLDKNPPLLRCGGKERKMVRLSNVKARKGIGSMFGFFKSSAEKSQLKAKRAKKSLGSCVRLMDSQEVENNRKGLKKVLSIAKRQNPGISYAVVYGLEVPYGNKLRDSLVKFLCDPSEAQAGEIPDNIDKAKTTRSDELMEILCKSGESMGDSNDLYNFLCEDNESGVRGESVPSGETFETGDEDDDDRPWGVHCGKLHKSALHVLTKLLEQAIAEEDDSHKVDFNCPFWKSVAATIVHNIEVNCSSDISGYSLRCLRQLHTMEQETTRTLVLRSLLPYISHLSQYGKQNNHSMINDESSRLLQDLAIKT
jgi:hypothetical protein